MSRFDIETDDNRIGLDCEENILYRDDEVLFVQPWQNILKKGTVISIIRTNRIRIFDGEFISNKKK